MTKSRDVMIGEWKRHAVPVLRSLGFKGSFPHFRRETDMACLRMGWIFLKGFWHASILSATEGGSWWISLHS